jgi:hypothetical protein
VRALDPLVGEWEMCPEADWVPPDAPSARVRFEWMPGERFLVQRWEVPVPEAPDGIAIIGPGAGDAPYRQHYFDQRGVARLYDMSFDGRVWKLWREREDFSPLSFKQRFEGTLSDDGNSIEGRWEKTADDGSWELDFRVVFQRALGASASSQTRR